MARVLKTKAIGETIVVEFDFRDVMLWGEELTGATVSVEVWSGLDVEPSLMLDGDASYGEVTVGQYLQGGQPGVIYNLIASATGNSGATYVKTKRLAVVSDSSSFAPSDFPQLTGVLPDARVGVFYSEPLLITGGYQPYEFDDISAGVAPGWMSFNVVDNELVCSGTPNEGSSTTYTFTPQIRDAVNNLANDPQIFNVNTMVLSGDLGDGILAQTISGTYSQTGGTEPVTYTIDSGTFPAGVSLSSDGSYSGEFSASTTYSWRIKGVDANGVEAFLDDTCAVSQPEFIVVGARTSGISALCRSFDTVTWTSKDFTGGNSYIFRDTDTPDSIIIAGVNTARISQDDGASYSTCTGLSSNTICDGVYSNSIWMVYAYPDLNRSTTGGVAYSHTQPFSDGTYFVCGASVGNFVLAAGNSSAYSNDRGATWHGSHSFVFSGGSYSANAMVTDGTSFIASTNGSGSRFYIYDGLNSWTSLGSPFAGTVQAIAYDQIKGRLGAVSGNDFAYSDNFGSSWTVVSNIIPSGMTAVPRGLSACSGMWLVSCNDTSNHRIYSSLDGGATWARRTSGFTLNFFSRGTNMTVVAP